MSWEQVYTVEMFHDRPISGLANFRGMPHLYEAQFDEVADEYSWIYTLKPVDLPLFEMKMEASRIFQRWAEAFDNGSAAMDAHPSFSANRTLHKSLYDAIDARVASLPVDCRLAEAEFRLTSGGEREVRWRITGDPV